MMGRYGLWSALRGVHLAGTVCPGDGGRPPGMRWRRSNGAHGFWADPRSHPFGPGTGHRGHPGERDSLGGGPPLGELVQPTDVLIPSTAEHLRREFQGAGAIIAMPSSPPPPPFSPPDAARATTSAPSWMEPVCPPAWRERCSAEWLLPIPGPTSRRRYTWPTL